LNEPGVQPDRRAERRDARRATNRTEILDAAERVFGERGPRDGSLREIAALSGFSTAAIYLFFENKQDVLSEMLNRRGSELVGAMQQVAAAGLAPLDALHRIADEAISFFDGRPDFRRLLRHITGGAIITEQVLAELTGHAASGYFGSMQLLTGIVSDGQAAGEIRDGDPGAIAQIYAVLVNEFVILASPESSSGCLTPAQFHELLDGALRDPSARPVRSSGRRRSGARSRG
jgi:AcrR family transcriptional regulator